MIKAVLTKADVIGPFELAKLDKQACGLSCAGCGVLLPTEGDFARHFVLPSKIYLNVGLCPDTERGAALTRTRLHY